MRSPTARAPGHFSVRRGVSARLLAQSPLARLAAARIPILEGPYAFGDTRAVLIEDLDGLALELIEAGS